MTTTRVQSAQSGGALREHSLEEIATAIRLQGLEPLDIPPAVTVADLASVMDVGPVEVIKELMRSGYMFTINDVIEHDLASLVAPGFGFGVLPLDAESSKSAGFHFAGDLCGRGGRSGCPPAASAGHNYSRTRGSRQDHPARHHPKRQRRGGRGRRHNPAHRRIPDRLRGYAGDLSGYAGPRGVHRNRAQEGRRSRT